jgi:hypothetical protein
LHQQPAKRASRRDREVLAFIGEQFAVTLPQLELLIGRSDRSARWLRTRLERAGWIQARQIFTSTPTICWLTGTGARIAGHWYKTWRPGDAGATLGKMIVLTDVRLAAKREFPSMIWTPRRELFALNRGNPEPEHLPDARITFHGVEAAVELIEDKLDERAARRRMRLSLIGCGRVVFFAPAAAAKQLQKITAGEPYVSVVDFNHDPYQPRALMLPPLDQIIPNFRTPTPETDPWDDPPALDTDRFGHAPIPAQSGALPNRPPDQLPKTERPLSDAPRVRLRGDDPAPLPAPQHRRNWRL